MELLIPLYVWCAIWWGVFCVFMHKKTRKTITFRKMVTVLFLNTIGMPISLVIAAFNTYKNLDLK